MFDLYFSEATSIGKSYRKQDMIGTYICLTVDFDTVDDKKVTCRNRDTREQERIEIENLENYLNQIYKSFANNFYD